MVDIMPYNFVPLCEKKDLVSPISPDDPSLLEGRLRCTLQIESPVFIPNTTGDRFFEDDEQKIREFYSRKIYTQKPTQSDSEPSEPIIPGSSIRGVLRSVYEAATNSCLSVLGDKYILTTRQPFTRYPGILKKTGTDYQLFKAIRYRTDCAQTGERQIRFLYNPTTQIAFHTGDHVRFQTEIRNRNELWVNMNTIEKDRTDQPDEGGWLHGIVLASEQGITKQSDAIFVPTGTPRSVPSEHIERLRQIIELYANPARNKHLKRGHTGYRGYSIFNAKSGLPVYVMELPSLTHRPEDIIYYFSPACISKNIYEKTLNSLVSALKYAPCTGINENGQHDLCPACSLFGMVGKSKNGRAYGSRIRITDALPSSKITYGTFRTIAPQMEPNVSAVEMYTLPPNEYANTPFGNNKGWTFDYVTQDGSSLKPLSSTEPKLRGRKFYWHFAAQTFDENSRYRIDRNGRRNKVISERFTPIIHPIERGTFEFDLYFDGITETELRRLIVLICLPDEDGFIGKHKIGAAKALGYGSVKMNVTQVEIHTINIEDNRIAMNFNNKKDCYKDLTCFLGKNAVFCMDGRDDLKSLRAILNTKSLNKDEISVQYLPLSAYKANRNVMGKLVIKNAYMLPTALGLLASLNSEQYSEEDKTTEISEENLKSLSIAGKQITFSNRTGRKSSKRKKR